MENLPVFQPNSTTHCLFYSGEGLSWSSQWILTKYELGSGIMSRWFFLVGHPANNLTRHWRQKYSRTNWIQTRMLKSRWFWRTYKRHVHCCYGATGESSWDPKQGATPSYFLNLILCGKLCEAVRFVFKQEPGGVLQHGDLASYKMGVINETVTSILAGKHPHEKIPACSMLEAYDETTILFLWKLRRMWSDRSHGNFRGVWAQ